MAKLRSAFREYLEVIIAKGRDHLQRGGLIDADTGGPDMELIRPLLGPQEAELPEEIDAPLISSDWIGAAHEKQGDLAEAIAWYRLGKYKWRGSEQFAHVKGDPPDLIYRDAAAQNQLPAAVCADRVGDRERALNLYSWAAVNRRLTPAEIKHAERKGYYQTVWQRLPFRAYALACLERWEEALSVAEEAQRWVEKDQRAKTKESYQAPLRILPVVLAITRYEVNRTDDNRRKVQEMLDPQWVATRSHPDHLSTLFYLYNLHARHPDLASPSAEELPPAELARLGAEACQKWMAHCGIHLDGTAESLKLLDERTKAIYKAAQNDGEGKNFLFLWGSYFGEVVRRELAGGQWKFSKKNFLESTVDWDIGEVELHLWPFKHAFEFVTGPKKETFYQLWQESEKSYINFGMAAKYSD